MNNNEHKRMAKVLTNDLRHLLKTQAFAAFDY
jgi:hypothetical protein